LFEIDNYRVWGKYLSNIRWIKRIYNNTLALLTDEKRKKYLKEIFDINIGIKFDDFIKLSLLKSYAPDIFQKIYEETVLEVDNLQYNTNMFKLSESFTLDDKKTYYQDSFIKFINSLPQEKRILLSNIFGLPEWKINSDEKVWVSYDPSKNRNDIQFSHNLQRHLQVINLDFSEYDKMIIYENYLSEQITKLEKSQETIWDIVSSVYNKYKELWITEHNEQWIKDFFDKIAYFYIKAWENKEEISIECINCIINTFHIYKDTWLYSSVAFWLSSFLDHCSQDKICWLLFWEDSTKWIIDRLFDEKWGVIGIYVNLWMFQMLSDEKDVSWKNLKSGLNPTYIKDYAEKILTWFEKNYMDKKINIFGEIENWLSSKWEWFLQYFIYQLTINVWKYDEGMKSKLNKYYFEDCFSWNNNKYLIDYMILSYNSSKMQGGNWLSGLNEVFEEDKFIEHLKNNKDQIEKYVKKNENKIVFNKISYGKEESMTLMKFWLFIQKKVMQKNEDGTNP